MLDKLKFNNLVITNKKLIQKGRAQTIAKLVNKLRKLKDAQEKQPEEKKHQDRLRRNVECMAELKALKHMEIMRALLLQEDSKKHTAILTNGRATPDERAIAMLGLSKILQTLVAAFRQALNLSDAAGADWRDELLQTSKRRLKLERTEEKRRKRQELKAQKAQTRNRLEWLEEHQPEADTAPALQSNIIETAVGICVVESAAKAEPTKKDGKDKSTNTPKRKDQSLKKVKTNVKQQKRKDKVTKADRKTNVMTEDAQINQTEVKQKDQKINEQRLQNQKMKEEGQQSKAKLFQQGQKPQREVEKPKKEEKQRPTHVVDPFFITESGQPYLSSAVVLSDDSHNESDAEEHYVEQRKRKPLAKKPEYNDSYKNSYNNNNSFSNSYTKNNYSISSSNNSNPRSNDRHPSWLAKEQQKPTITNFKGKKIKFSDEGNVAETTTTSAAADPAPVTVVDGMHPSWVAKQKMKPKIAAFKGTKIKFDD